MLDLHCHILYGVDDGAPDLDTAVEMARCLADAGFRRVAASPHLGLGPGGDVRPGLARERREVLNARLRGEGIDVQILPNAEHHVTPELFERLKAGDVVPVGGAGRWLLVELPWQAIPDPETILFRVQLLGYRLLLAHPERYGYVDVGMVRRLVQRGVRMQLELGSFVGVYGGRAQARAEELMQQNLGHVLATDLHRPKQAEIWLAQALGVVRKRYGQAALERGTLGNPEAIVADAATDSVGALCD
jgi:protein-tyrosine phosphatase